MKDCFITLALVFVFFVLGYSVGYKDADKDRDQELLDVGYAEYVVNSKTGESTFQLKTPMNILKGWGTWESYFK